MTTYPDDADGNVLADLAAHGVDMSQPLPIEFTVAAPNESSAQAIERALAKAGYATEVYFDEGEPDAAGKIDPDDPEFGPSWTVYAHVRMIPTYDEIMRIQADLTRLVEPLNGHADGWGALVDGAEK
jgi:hypothetical protein